MISFTKVNLTLRQSIMSMDSCLETVVIRLLIVIETNNYHDGNTMTPLNPIIIIICLSDVSLFY